MLEAFGVDAALCLICSDSSGKRGRQNPGGTCYASPFILSDNESVVMTGICRIDVREVIL